jgi:PEP-CTERM motif
VPVYTDILATLSVPVSQIPDADGQLPSTPTVFDLGNQAFGITAGAVLAIELLSTATDQNYRWVFTLPGGPNGGYTGGQAYSRVWNPPTPYSPELNNSDFGFQTYVQTASVPEPSALTLALSGAALGLFFAWRRRPGGRANGTKGT